MFKRQPWPPPPNPYLWDCVGCTDQKDPFWSLRPMPEPLLSALGAWGMPAGIPGSRVSWDFMGCEKNTHHENVLILSLSPRPQASWTHCPWLVTWAATSLLGYREPGWCLAAVCVHVCVCTCVYVCVCACMHACSELSENRKGDGMADV